MGINWLLRAPCRIQLKAKIQLGQFCSVDLDPMLTCCIFKRSDLPSWRSRPCLQVISVMCVVVGTLQLYIARAKTMVRAARVLIFHHSCTFCRNQQCQAEIWGVCLSFIWEFVSLLDSGPCVNGWGVCCSRACGHCGNIRDSWGA